MKEEGEEKRRVGRRGGGGSKKGGESRGRNDVRLARSVGVYAVLFSHEVCPMVHCPGTAA